MNNLSQPVIKKRGRPFKNPISSDNKSINSSSDRNKKMESFFPKVNQQSNTSINQQSAFNIKDKQSNSNLINEKTNQQSTSNLVNQKINQQSTFNLANFLNSNFAIREQEMFKQLELLINYAKAQQNELKNIKNCNSKIKFDYQPTKTINTSEIENMLNNTEINLNNIDKLLKYNYLNWSNQLKIRLNKYKLDYFLFKNSLINNQDQINLDKKVKDLILSTIDNLNELKLNNETNCTTFDLWNLIKLQFYDKFISKKKTNLNYVSRFSLKSISGIKDHIEKFRLSIDELKAIDLEFGQKMLIQLFINSFSKNLPSFADMLDKSDKSTIDEILKFSAQQSIFLIKMYQSKDPITENDYKNKRIKTNHVIELMDDTD